MIRMLVPILVVALNSSLVAQTTRPTRVANVSVSRADLADSFLRFELTLQKHPPQPQQVPLINRGFDEATFWFFGGQHARAVQRLNELTDQLRPLEARSLQNTFLESLRIRVGPPIGVASRPGPIRVKIETMYRLEMQQPLDLRLVLHPESDPQRILAEKLIRFSSDSPAEIFTMAQPANLPIGRYTVRLIAPDGSYRVAPTWYVVNSSLDNYRAMNERRLTAPLNITEKLKHAYHAVRARNNLLTDRPNEADSGSFLADPIELSRLVDIELELLLKGEDPYIERPGDLWRTITAGVMNIPARVYAPKTVIENRKTGKRMPLVIALHGAGGDENMFFEAYGAGRIKQLADQHDFIVVSPSTYFIIPNPQALPAIVQAMSDAYPIDSSRIYILGHSMGAMAAQGLLSRQPRILAASALIAGGNAFTNTQNMPPTLVYAGEIDPIFPMQRMVRIWQDATAAGLPVDLQVAKGFGHTLVVGEVLPEVIQWLLKHRYDAPATQPAQVDSALEDHLREQRNGTAPATGPSN